MNNFKRSAIAVVVSTAFVLPGQSAFADALQQLAAAEGAQLSTTQQQPTVSGMTNQVDAQSSETTFSWAPTGLAKPNISAVAPEYQLEFAATHYLNALTGAADKGGLVQLKPVLAHSYQSEDGVKTAKFRQQFMGIDVFNKEYNILMDAEFNLVAGSGRLVNVAAAKTALAANAQFAYADDAVKAAFAASGGDGSQLSLTETTEENGYAVFSVNNADNSKKVLGTPRVKPVYFEKKGKLIAAQYVEIETSNHNDTDSDYFAYVIAGDTGEVLFKNNLKAHAGEFEYRVYANADGRPWDGPHGNVVPAESADQVDATAYLAAPLVKVAHGPIKSKDLWLKSDATTTSGNNVFAYVDAIAPNGFTTGDFAAETTGPLVFDYKYRTSEPESSVNNRKAAIVNLFYMNNYLHDQFYDYGFDEKAGNAQLVNYGRGGVEGDPIMAEVQDNSGFDNANMSTPADGRSPRMQMYLWASKDAVFGKDLGITAKTADGTALTLTAMQGASFGPGQFSAEGQAVTFVDTAAPTRDGCTAAATPADVAGKIAIIDRGTCNFTVKVKNAQLAGAIGVVIVNNAAAGLPGMGGADASVTIPSVGISQAEGKAIYDAIAAGKVVNIKMFNNRPFKDSSWDNAIVSHEWGHYISNRLVGNGNGLYNNQGRAMGEGWGDFHALLTVSDASDLKLAGNDKMQRAYAAISYVDSFYYGIRSFPNGNSLEINPRTFKHIGLGDPAKYFTVQDPDTGAAQVHSAGSVWAQMLWQSFVNLVNHHKDYDKAKDRMMGYLVNGYKLTPVGPTYTEARDAILAAAFAKDPEDYKVILKAFADRGMGLGAVAPHRDDPQHTGVVESFKTELSTFNVTAHKVDKSFSDATTGFCTNNSTLDNGETATVQFNVTNKGSSVLKDLKGKIEVTSGHQVTFANGGAITLPELKVMSSATTTPLAFKLEGAKPGDVLQLKLSFPEVDESVVTSEYSLSERVNLAFATVAPSNMQSTDNMETLATLNNFSEKVLVGGDLAKDSRQLDPTYAAFFASQGHPVGKQYMHIANNGFTSDVVYETKAFTVGYAGDFKMSFWHYYEFEEAYDGGVVEISINGSAWTDVTKVIRSAAGQPVQYAGFSSQGYTSELAELLPGRKAFTGIMDSDPVKGSTTFGRNETINFGAALNGNEVKFRFRAVSDSNSNESGWYIDNVQFNNITTPVFHSVVAGDSVACDNRAPLLSGVKASVAELNEGGSFTLTASATDRDTADKLAFSWKQLSGTAATLTNANTATASVTAPSIASGSENLVFEVAVTDGTATTKSTVTVKVNDVPAPEVVTPTKKSGGGSMGWFSLLLAPLALLRRRSR
ncbi:MAG: GlyGly-CTERM sorting domain-containing protein [Rheinheimera sp.]|nr:MAG: GlyGly-CTERM sorting domain-containing protein [Rheinheimera sp.]